MSSKRFRETTNRASMTDTPTSDTPTYIVPHEVYILTAYGQAALLFIGSLLCIRSGMAMGMARVQGMCFMSCSFLIIIVRLYMSNFYKNLICDWMYNFNIFLLTAKEHEYETNHSCMKDAASL